MSRKYSQYKSEGNKALHESAYNAALMRINKLRDNVVAQFVNFDPFSVQDVLDILFTPEVQRIAREAEGVVQGGYGDPYYLLTSAYDVRITEMRQRHGMMAVEEKHASVNMTPMYQAMAPELDKLRDIYQTWRTVSYVLTEMNKRCTISALRAYWPTAGALARGSLPDEMPSTYREPLTIGGLTPLLRETADTVAMGLMAPACETIDARMVLKLRDHKFVRGGIEISMESDEYILI